MTVAETERGWCGRCSGYLKIYGEALRYVFNLEMIFWLLLSTAGVYFMCDHRNNLHQLVTATWILSYTFCCLVCGVTIANKEIVTTIEQLQDLGQNHQLIPDQEETD